MNIRKLTLNDATQFKNLRVNAVEECPASFYPTKNELVETSDDEFGMQVTSSDWATVYGAFDENGLIGIVGIKRDKRTKVRHKAAIWGMYVKQSHRGRGIARQLMQAALSHAESFSEIITVTLSVNSINTAAKSLYLNFGFVPYGMERNSIKVNGEFIHEEHMMLGFSKKENYPLDMSGTGR